MGGRPRPGPVGRAMVQPETALFTLERASATMAIPWHTGRTPGIQR